MKEADASEKLDRGWTMKYITDFAIPVDFYLRVKSTVPRSTTS
ncbi:MAG: hypothetical protein U5L72_06580 [Bacteroidales bacterium]|nr:hypothetical protein [Bacteroidales bacterium]